MRLLVVYLAVALALAVAPLALLAQATATGEPHGHGADGTGIRLTDDGDAAAASVTSADDAELREVGMLPRVWRRDLSNNSYKRRMKHAQLLRVLSDGGAESGLPVMSASEPEILRALGDATRLVDSKTAALSHELLVDARWTLAELRLFGHRHFGESTRNVSLAVEMYRELANSSGHPGAHQRLAVVFGTGLAGMFPVDQSKSILHYHLAALEGNTQADMALGFRYSLGIAVEASCARAQKHYRRAADQVAHYLRSQFYVELPPLPSKHRFVYDHGGIYGAGASSVVASPDAVYETNLGVVSQADAIQFYRFSADRGEPSTQWHVGRFYYRGSRHIPRDWTRAARYLRKAASSLSSLPLRSDLTPSEKADVKAAADAAALLGQMYVRGEGVARSNRTAFDYFRRAMNAGGSMGAVGLAKMYMHGNDVVAKDVTKAVEYLKEAARSDDLEAHVQLGIYFTEGPVRDYRAAIQHFLVAGNKAHLVALYYLARYHQDGVMVESSCATSVQFYKNVVERGDFKQPHVTRALESYARGDVTGSLIRHVVAAELGYESAQSNVAFLLETEQVTIGDEDWQRFEAFTQWKRAANQGNVDAQIKTGDYFYYGLGVPVDYRKAVQMYRAAEVENSALALFNLGYMHENGLGIQQDFHLAKRYYDQSLALNAEASLAVSLALLKLNARHFFRWLWYGGSFFLDAPPHEHGRAGAASSPESSASIAPLNDDENAMMDDHVDEDDDHADAHMWHDEEESSETIVILILAFLAGAIMLQRQQPDPRQGEAGNGGVRQNDAPQPEARAAAAERVDNEQDNANDNA